MGIFLGGIDFTGLSYTVGEAVFEYGTFIQSVIDFVIVAFVIFLIIKLIAKTQKPEEVKDAAPQGPTEIELLTEIRDSLKR